MSNAIISGRDVLYEFRRLSLQSLYESDLNTHRRTQYYVKSYRTGIFDKLVRSVLFG